MSPMVATIFRADRIIDSSLFGNLIRVLCAKTGKSNFDVARFVFRCAVFFLVISMVLMVIYGLFSRHLMDMFLPLAIMLFIGKGFNYESQKLSVIEREVNDSLTRKAELSKLLLGYWSEDRMKRTFFFFLALMLPIIIILRGSRLDLADISFILMSIFWLMWSFYFYVLYHLLSLPSSTETEK